MIKETRACAYREFTNSGFIPHMLQVWSKFFPQNRLFLGAIGVAESSDLAFEEVQALLSLCGAGTIMVDHFLHFTTVSIQPEEADQPRGLLIIICQEVFVAGN